MFVVLEGVVNSGKTTVMDKLAKIGQRIKVLEFNNLPAENEGETISQDYYLKRYESHLEYIQNAKQDESRLFVVSHYFDGAIAYLKALGEATDKLENEKNKFPEPDYKVFLNASNGVSCQRFGNRPIIGGDNISTINMSLREMVAESKNWYIIDTDMISEEAVFRNFEDYINKNWHLEVDFDKQ